MKSIFVFLSFILCFGLEAEIIIPTDTLVFPILNYDYDDQGCIDWGDDSNNFGGWHVADDFCVDVGTGVRFVGNGRVKYTQIDPTGENIYPRYWYALVVTESHLPTGDKFCTIYGHVKTDNYHYGDFAEGIDFFGEVVQYPPDDDHIHFGIYNGAYQTKEGEGSDYSLGGWLKGYENSFPGSYVDPIAFIFEQQYDSTYSYSFSSGSNDGWSFEWDLEFLTPGESGVFSTHVTGDNPGIKSPEYSPMIFAKGAVAHFSMKIVGQTLTFYEDEEERKISNECQVWARAADDSWHLVNVELANADYYYDPNNDGVYDVVQNDYNVYRVNFSNLSNDFEIVQFSIEPVQSAGSGNIQCFIDWVKIYEKASFIVMDTAVICEDTVRDGQYDLNFVNETANFQYGEKVLCFTELRNIFLSHRMKVVAYTMNDQTEEWDQQWDWKGPWHNVSGMWGFSHFVPSWDNAPVGQHKLKIYIDFVSGNAETADDWVLLGESEFQVNGDLVVADNYSIFLSSSSPSATTVYYNGVAYSPVELLAQAVS